MEENNDRLKAAGERVRSKIDASSGVAMPQETFEVEESIRQSNGSILRTSPVDDARKPKRRVTRMSRKRYRKRNSAYVVLVLFFAAVIGFSVWMIVRNKKAEATPVPAESDTVTVTDAETFEALATETADSSSKEAPKNTVTVDNKTVHEGNLILVNYKYAYVFPDEEILHSMKERAEHYSVSALNVTLQSEAIDAFVKLTNDQFADNGFDGILVVSSFRGMEKQREIYQDRLDRYGSEYAAKYVADPGYSEHHTGLAMDLSVHTGGASYDIETYEKCDYFNKNYDKYGYILRYPEHKAGITSINYEGWHYRYVGIPHSQIMDSLDLCLEEYIDYLRSFNPANAICFNKSTGSISTVDAATRTPSADESIVYFVPASEGDTTDIPVTGEPYKISGNNVDGFIVTIN